MISRMKSPTMEESKLSANFFYFSGVTLISIQSDIQIYIQLYKVKYS